jgi:hypothetical protein
VFNKGLGKKLTKLREERNDISLGRMMRTLIYNEYQSLKQRQELAEMYKKNDKQFY